MRNYFICAVFCLFGLNALGQNKYSYSVFKPVPRDSLREMETDRPDVSESPKTVDAGHFQIEADLFRFQRQKKGTGENRVVNEKGFLQILRSKTNDGIYHHRNSGQVAKISPRTISIIPENTKSRPAPVIGEIREFTRIVPKDGYSDCFDISGAAF